MPRYTFQDSYGRKVTLEGDTPPTENDLDAIFSSLKPPQKSNTLMTQQGFAKNILKDVGQNIQSNAELAAYAFPPLAAMKAASGQNIYNPQRLQTIGSGIVQGVKETPKRFINELAHPIQSMYEKPISTGVDLATLASLGAKAAGGIVNTAKPMLKGVGRQLESMSGSRPGSLEAEYKNPLLILSKGTEAATPLYEAGKKIGGPVSSELKRTPGKIDFVQKASDLADEGKLGATDALEARKELDQIKKKVTGEFFRTTREKLDNIAKQAFSEADPVYKKGLMAESLRKIIPQNKYGGASAYKAQTIAALSGLGGFIGGPTGAAIGGAVGTGLMSPLAQGVAAGTLGTAAKLAAPIASAAPILTAGQIDKTITENIKPPKVLTEKIANKYLRKALRTTGGDIELARKEARKMAIKDGYEIPE